MILHVLRKDQKKNSREIKLDLNEFSNETSCRFIIGRSENCFIVLDDKKISREHAELVHHDDRWHVKALSDFSFLTVNGESLTESEIKDRDKIELGSFVLKVELENKDNISSTVSEIEETDIAEGEEFQDDFADEELEETSDDFEEQDLEENHDEQDQFEEDLAEVTKIIKHFSEYYLELFGECAPYDHYQIMSDKVIIGRDESKCEIVLDDVQVSSEHAFIEKKGGVIVLEDMKSGNGILLNGKRINRKQLAEHDEFIIGSTTFTLKVKSELLKEENKHLLPVEKEQFIEVEEIIESNEKFAEGATEVQEKSLIKRIWKDPVKRKKAIYVMVGLVLLWVMFDEEKPPVKNKIKKEVVEVKESLKKKQKYSKEKLDFLESHYQLAIILLKTGKFRESILKIEKVLGIDKEYREALMIYRSGLEKLAEIEKFEKIKAEEIENLIVDKKIKKLVEQAHDAVNDKNYILAESVFNQILKLRPENVDVFDLRNKIEAIQIQEREEALLRAKTIEERRKKVVQLAPGKNYFLNKKWHKTIIKLNNFLMIKNMDEDLIKEASSMLETSKNKLKTIISPLLSRARSLKKGQDLKGAYQLYLNVLKYDPTQLESLNEMDRIRKILKINSRKIYRDGLISESLSLFNDSREKFQEVQQISPTDSEYYEKASLKLKDYVQ